MKKRIITVLNIAGLSPALLENAKNMPNIKRLKEDGMYRKMKPTFPAVTCSVQASLLSGKPPADHGIVANGYFDTVGMRPEFWRQENALVSGSRIWDIMREKDCNAKVAVLFWQNSKYIDADIVITPSPLHSDTGLIEWCYSKPTGMYETIAKKFGEFNLMSYWGPFAGKKSSEWITKASLEILKEEQPDILLAYIPHLDYICQRFSQGSNEVTDGLAFIDNIVGEFMDFREKYGPEHFVLFMVSEYGFVDVRNTIFPNLVLREHGLLKVREIKGQEYIDFEQSDAFAIVDHQIAHIHCKKNMIKRTRDVLTGIKNISSVIDRDQQKNLEIHHSRSGDLIALANKDSWFAYYYWYDENKAPFYARTVDIHNKPGYDPCELFIDPESKTIPLKPQLVKGSHGLPAENDEQLAIMICSQNELKEYAPDDFNAMQFLSMLYRVI